MSLAVVLNYTYYPIIPRIIRTFATSNSLNNDNMKKIFAIILCCLPCLAYAQSELTTQQQLEKAQKELKEAQEALEKAKANAQKAQDAAQKETARLKEEAQKLQDESTSVTPKEETRHDNSTDKTYEQNAWIAPTNEENRVAKTKANKEAEENLDAIYLDPNAVTLTNGVVEWTETISAPGKTAEDLYQRTYQYLQDLTNDENQLEGSKVALVNKEEHSIIANVREWLVFSTNFLSIDRCKFSYILIAKCENGKVTLTMSRLVYNYDLQGKSLTYKAENWITNKEAVNKKGTKLQPISGKFRRKTIDRKNEIVKNLKFAIFS